MAIQTHPAKQDALVPIGMPSDGPGLTEYVGVFSRRPGLVVVPLVLFTLVAGLVAFIVPRRYESWTLLKVKDTQLLKSLVGNTRVDLPYKPELQTIKTDIKRTAFIEPIIKKIGLTEGFNPADRKEALELRQYIYDNLSIDLNSPRVGSDTIRITYQGRDPDKVMQFVNEVRIRYTEQFVAEYSRAIQKLYESLRKQRRSLDRRLTNLRAEWERFSTEENMQLLNTEADKRRILGELKSKRIELESQINLLRVREKALIRELNEAKKTVIEPSLTRNPELVKAEAELARLNAAYVVLTQVKGWTRQTPKVQELEKSIEKAKAVVASLSSTEWVPDTRIIKTNPNYTRLQADLQDTKRELLASHRTLSDILGRIKTLEKETERIPELQRRQKRYEDDQKLLLASRRITDSDYTRVKNTWDVIRNKGGGIFTVVELPNNDADPVFPSIPMFLGIGAAVGLLLGIGMAFLKEFSGVTFATTGQVSNVLPVPVLGAVSRIRTDSQLKAERSRRRRLIIVLLALVAVIVLVHVFYFNPNLAQSLPTWVVEALDQMYKGR